MGSTPVRFGLFEFSPGTGELLREGVPVRLQPQPAKVLALLVARPGAVVTREELQREVWGNNDIHVDFERGLNFCIAQVRTALGDSADGARYIATVPKQGYRFVAPVSSDERTDAPTRWAPFTQRPFFAPFASLAVLSLIILAALALARGRANPTIVVVIPFYNETGNAAHDTLAASLGDVLVARLAAPDRTRSLSVIGNAPALRNPFARQDVQEISRKLGAEFLVIGQLKTDGGRLGLVAHLIRASDMKHLWANTFDDDDFPLDEQQRVAEAVAAAVVASLTVQDR
jgi:DNA-binding winged helix-turn-helix (wHTH) protein/TolB-like protein